MRTKRTSQIRLFDPFAAHDIGRELQGMSDLLDAHPVLLDFVADDLGSSAATGRCGLTAESALRCALLKQHRQLIYDELAFHLLDSASFGAFARLPVDWTPSKAALQGNIAAMTETTWNGVEPQDTLGYLEHSAARLRASGVEVFALMAWQADVERLKPLIRRVIDQTQRRVFNGESVPAAEKIVSLFEPQPDIIVKDRRAVHYGDKLNLTSGRSGLIFDIVIEAGNPADAERFIPMLERHIDTFGTVPRQVAADGGYASKDNLVAARQAGVEDVAFHKNADSKSRTWHAARGCIANCATSGRGSKPAFPA